ncbi:hypothetical protein [Actinoplanes sp. NPDC051411]|uniref:hypothetical protein n=1 Tax=Actinoplanes sp. NPDC051411 TaxID=3155522 RepID=UPI0034258228
MTAFSDGGCRFISRPNRIRSRRQPLRVDHTALDAAPEDLVGPERRLPGGCRARAVCTLNRAATSARERDA